MTVTRTATVPLESEGDIVQARRIARAWAAEQRFSLIDQTKFVTAASELARNTVVHGKGGAMDIELVVENERTGIRLTFIDHGPGIPNINLALQDGFTTSNGLGLGLGGAKRLVNDFSIASKLGEGTRVSIIRWK